MKGGGIALALGVALFASTSLIANEIDGFRLGMTLEQAMKVAADRNYSLRKALTGDLPWGMIAYLKHGHYTAVEIRRRQQISALLRIARALAGGEPTAF